MKTLGLIGGMSWNSTELYYRLLNQSIAQRLGGLHSAKILLHSFDFADIASLQQSGDWAAAGRVMVEAAHGLKQAGADAIVICTNTMHMFAREIEAETGLPVLHIGDAVAATLRAQGITHAGLLGTYFTMNMDFYADYYRSQHSIDLLVPEEADKQLISHIIYDELCRGIVTPASRAQYLSIMENLRSQGAEAIILGCTEIGLLIKPEDFPALPIIDSTELHAQYAASFAVA